MQTECKTKPFSSVCDVHKIFTNLCSVQRENAPALDNILYEGNHFGRIADSSSGHRHLHQYLDTTQNKINDESSYMIAR